MTVIKYISPTVMHEVPFYRDGKVISTWEEYGFLLLDKDHKDVINNHRGYKVKFESESAYTMFILRFS
jgi:hypothetical protein